MLACFQLAYGEDGDSDHAHRHASKAIVYPAPIQPLFQLYRARVSKLKQKRNLRLKLISLIAYKRRNKKISANHHRAWEVQSSISIPGFYHVYLQGVAYYGIPMKGVFVSHP